MQGSASKLVLLLLAVACLVGMMPRAEAWRGISWSGHASREVKATASIASFDAQEDGNGSRRLLTTYTPVSSAADQIRSQQGLVSLSAAPAVISRWPGACLLPGYSVVASARCDANVFRISSAFPLPGQFVS